MAKRKHSTKKFKPEAVRLANEPDQSFQVSKNLGVSDSALHHRARELGTQNSVSRPGSRSSCWITPRFIGARLFRRNGPNGRRKGCSCGICHLMRPS